MSFFGTRGEGSSRAHGNNEIHVLGRNVPLNIVRRTLMTEDELFWPYQYFIKFKFDRHVSILDIMRAEKDKPRMQEYLTMKYGSDGLSTSAAWFEDVKSYLHGEIFCHKKASGDQISEWAYFEDADGDEYEVTRLGVYDILTIWDADPIQVHHASCSDFLDNLNLHIESDENVNLDTKLKQTMEYLFSGDSFKGVHNILQVDVEVIHRVRREASQPRDPQSWMEE